MARFGWGAAMLLAVIFTGIATAQAKPIHMVVVPGTSPYRTLQEVIGAARRDPHKVSFGTTGDGTAAYLACQQFMQRAGVELVHIPFKSTAAAFASLSRGQVAFICETEAAFISRARSGRFNSVAVIQASRSASVPDVPSLDEVLQQDVRLQQKPVIEQQPSIKAAPDVAVIPSSGRRVALVIGNSAYSALPLLVNPSNDAEDIAKALEAVGFEVEVGTDLTRTQMEDALGTFSRKARSAETALVYFSGHGLQHNGINYLAPVDARLEDEADLRKLILLQNVIDDLQGASRIRLLFVDACRDNEAVQQLASRLPRTRAAAFKVGLAAASADGTLIAFATQRDRLALDGSGRNSPFTHAFLKHLPTAGLELRTLLTRVRAEVVEITGGAQRPEVSDSLVGEFTFR